MSMIEVTQGHLMALELVKPSATPEQDPVAWANSKRLKSCTEEPFNQSGDPKNISGCAKKTNYCDTPLYAYPPEVVWTHKPVPVDFDLQAAKAMFENAAANCLSDHNYEPSFLADPDYPDGRYKEPGIRAAWMVFIELGVASAAPEQEPVEIDWPEFHEVAMGCGLEDRGITDRYEAMRYGYEEALDQASQVFEGIGPLYTHADPSEVAQLRAELAKAQRNEHNSEVAYRAAIERQDELRADRDAATKRADAADRKLGEAVGVLRDIAHAYRTTTCSVYKILPRADALISASAEPAKCTTCQGRGEIYSGQDQHFDYFEFQPPEPIMDVCPECGGDGEV